MKLVLGAGNTHFEGWVSTQEDNLNLLDYQSFASQYKENCIEAMLAEHVWEHMSKEEGIIASRNCYDFLKDGGYIRVAVPDANFRNEWYQNMVKVGGPGPVNHPAYTHKIVYDYKNLVDVFEQAGFQVELLEYCDEAGNFHYKYWNDADGHIGRSFRYDTRNSLEKLGMVSIIIDAKKELVVNLSE